MEKLAKQNTELVEDRSYLIQYLRDRTDKKKLNSIIIIIGEPGMGKSYTSLSFAKRKDPSFNVRTCLIIKPSEFTAKVRETRKLMKEGKLIKDRTWVWDEIGVGMNSKKWNSLLNKSVNLVVQTFRNQCITLILNCPNLSFADSDLRRLLNFLFVMKKIDRKNNIAYFKPYKVKIKQYKDKDKMITPFLIDPITNTKVIMFKSKIPDKETIDYYEERKGDFQDELYTSIDNEVKRMDMLGKAKPSKRDSEIYNQFKDGKLQKDLAEQHKITPMQMSRLITKCKIYFSDD